MEYKTKDGQFISVDNILEEARPIVLAKFRDGEYHQQVFTCPGDSRSIYEMGESCIRDTLEKDSFRLKAEGLTKEKLIENVASSWIYNILNILLMETQK